MFFVPDLDEEPTPRQKALLDASERIDEGIALWIRVQVIKCERHRRGKPPLPEKLAQKLSEVGIR